MNRMDRSDFSAGSYDSYRLVMLYISTKLRKIIMNRMDRYDFSAGSYDSYRLVMLYISTKLRKIFQRFKFAKDHNCTARQCCLIWQNLSCAL